MSIFHQRKIKGRNLGPGGCPLTLLLGLYIRTYQSWLKNTALKQITYKYGKICIAHSQNISTHLKIGNFSVAELTSSVVAELNVPLTRQVEHQVRMLFDDSIKDVLVSQAGSVVSHEIFLSNLSPQLSPTQLPQSFKLQQYHPGVVSEAKPFAH